MTIHPIFRRFIYLDYDGVLQHSEVYTHPKRGIYIRAEGFTLFQWMTILEELLKQHPDVGIILSTSWVRAKGFGFAKKQLSPILQERVVGATFHKSHMNAELFAQMTRANQVLGDVERRGCDNWIAIDDDADGWPGTHADNLIRTEGDVGLSDPRVQDQVKAWLLKGQSDESPLTMDDLKGGVPKCEM